jgi:hypothetical protein
MDKSSKIATIVLWVLMIVSIALCVIMIASIDDQINPGEKARQLIDLNINWAILLFGIAAITVLGFAFVQIIGQKAKIISTLITLVIFGVIFGLSYAFASSELPTFYGVDKFIADGTLTPSVSRWVGTGLNLTYILFAGAALSVIGFGAASVFKRS